MNDVALIESPSLRQEFCTEENTSVLEKVGYLVKIPGTVFATTKQVAQFYAVPEETIRTIIARHKNELKTDGYNVLLRKDLGEFQDETLKTHARNIAVFPRRAVLRIGMVLRDSPVAKQVRNYLLNIEELSTKSAVSEDMLNKMATQLTIQAIALGKHAEQLDTHANQLTEYSRQLTENTFRATEHTAQLRQNAEQLIFQSKLIKAMIEEMYDNKHRIQHVESRVESYDKRIEALERLSESQNKREDEFISEEQVHFLKERIKSMGPSNKIWHKLKQHFGVTRYIFLPKSRFREVLDWLE